MARAPYKLPNVFVGCPYGGRFKFRQFKDTLERLPFRFYFADTHLATKHLLGILRNYISVADYCIFDVSTWNPNVALELGLADGMEAEYYILLHRKLSQGVPADIQGIQRIEYSNYDDYDEDDGLLPKLVKYLVKGHTHPRNIWDRLPAENRQRKFTLALRILAHFRDNVRLTAADRRQLSRGSYLRGPDVEEIVTVLEELGLVGNAHSRRGATLDKNLYKEPILF